MKLKNVLVFSLVGFCLSSYDASKNIIATYNLRKQPYAMQMTLAEDNTCNHYQIVSCQTCLNRTSPSAVANFTSNYWCSGSVGICFDDSDKENFKQCTRFCTRNGIQTTVLSDDNECQVEDSQVVLFVVSVIMVLICPICAMMGCVYMVVVHCRHRIHNKVIPFTEAPSRMPIYLGGDTETSDDDTPVDTHNSIMTTAIIVQNERIIEPEYLEVVEFTIPSDSSSYHISSEDPTAAIVSFSRSV